MQERTATGEWIEVVRIEGSGGASTGGGTAATPKTHPIDFTRISNDIQTISGAYSVTVSNVGGNDGTVNGTVLKDGETVSFDASAGNMLGAITVVAIGTELAIVVVGEAA